MDEMWIRLVFLVGGAVLGYAVALLRGVNNSLTSLHRRLDAIVPLTLPAGVGHAGTEEDPIITKPLEPIEVEVVSDTSRQRDERGATNFVNVGIVIALGVVLFSLFSTLRTNDKVSDTQADLAAAGAQRDRENDCTSSVLFSTVAAINERTTRTQAFNEANTALQQAQLQFLRVISQPGSNDAAGEEALGNYVEALTTFITAAEESKQTALENPYPTEDEYSQCLKEAREAQGAKDTP